MHGEGTSYEANVVRLMAREVTLAIGRENHEDQIEALWVMRQVWPECHVNDTEASVLMAELQNLPYGWEMN